MTQLPEKTDRKMGLVIDLDTCVGCHACVVSCRWAAFAAVWRSEPSD